MATATSGRPTRSQGLVLRIGWWALAWTGANSANLLSMARLLAAVPLALLVVNGSYLFAFWLFIAAAVSDAMDGFIAKRFNGCSSIGAILDPVADKLLIACLFPALAVVGAVPWWLVLLTVCRDLLIIVGVVGLRLYHGPFDARPLLVGKLCTLVQLVLGGVALCHVAGLLELGTVIEALVLLSGAFVLLSGLAYIGAFVRLTSQLSGRG